MVVFRYIAQSKANGIYRCCKWFTHLWAKCIRVMEFERTTIRLKSDLTCNWAWRIKRLPRSRPEKIACQMLKFARHVAPPPHKVSRPRRINKCAVEELGEGGGGWRMRGRGVRLGLIRGNEVGLVEKPLCWVWLFDPPNGEEGARVRESEQNKTHFGVFNLA